MHRLNMGFKKPRTAGALARSNFSVTITDDNGYRKPCVL